jgi:putative copper resistance protein D
MSVSMMLLHASVRWLEFLGLTTLLGGLAFRLLIVRPTLLSRQELESFERRRRNVQAGAIALLALTSAGDLILRTLVMSGSAAGLGVALPLVLQKTHYGSVWISRMVLVVLLATAWLLRRPGPSRSAWSTWASLLGAALIALTTTLSGHAADWGDVTVPVLSDWLHVLATGTWIGGLFAFGFVLSPCCQGDPGQSVAAMAPRFSRVAAGGATIFLLTGPYNAWVQVASFSPLVTTKYGWTLSVKLSLVLLALLAAAANRYYFVPLLADGSAGQGQPPLPWPGRLVATLLRRKGGLDREEIPRQFVRSIRFEWLAAVGVLACTALLTQLPPARHIRRHGHREQHAMDRPAQHAATAMGRRVNDR